MKFTYYGHSTFSLENSGQILLFDPFISPNPMAKDIHVKDLKVDILCVSHGHGDHIADATTIISHNKEITVIANPEIVGWLQKKESNAEYKGMNHGGTINFKGGSIKMVNAIHSSSLPDGSYGGNPSGFVITLGSKTVFYAGDTALTYDHKLIAEMYQVDCAILPIGDNYTMGIKEAILCAQFVGTKKVIGVHYDTFPAITIDKNLASNSFKEAGVTLLLPSIGESIEL